MLISPLCGEGRREGRGEEGSEGREEGGEGGRKGKGTKGKRNKQEREVDTMREKRGREIRTYEEGVGVGVEVGLKWGGGGMKGVGET